MKIINNLYIAVAAIDDKMLGKVNEATTNSSFIKKIFILILPFIFCLMAFQVANAQTQVSPKYSVDRSVTSLLSKGDTLIVAGTFSNVGIYTGGGALFKDTSDKPNTNLPKIIGTVYCSTPDGNGGFYIYGNYRRELETISEYRIEHILSDYTFESGFTIFVTSILKLSTITYSNGVLYIGGNTVSQIGEQNAGNLSALDVSTKSLLPWMPAVNGEVTGIFISQNRLFVTGGFTTIGGQNRNGIAEVEINTGTIKPWNPDLGGGYSDIKFYQNKIIIGGSFHDAAFDNHACATVDSVTGSNIDYIFNSSNLYWAAGISKLALQGDTLFAFSAGTEDTRITAVNLSNKSILWEKYFNMTAGASGMEVIDTSLYVAGSSFDAIYKTNLSNSNDADIEQNIKGAVKLNIHSGNLINWSPNPVGLIHNDIYTMASVDKNIFIGGDFSHVNGLQRVGILMLNTVTGEVLPFKIDFDILNGCNALKLIDSTLYMAGDFSTVNGQPYLASVIACNVRTGALLPWHPDKLGNAWTVEANGKYVFLAGSLTEPAGGSGRTNLFAIDRQTGSLANWAPNPDYNVSTNSLHIANGRLYVGGNFTKISEQNRSYLVSYDTATLSLTNWTPSVYSAVTAIASTDTSIWIASHLFETNINSTGLFAGINPQTGLVTNTPTTSLPVSGQVNFLITKGRYVIAGGDLTINSSPCNYLSMYDMQSKSLIPNGFFCQSFATGTGGSVNTMAMANNDLYIGGDFAELNNKLNATNIERIKYPVGYFDTATDTTYSFYPAQAGNGGDVTINFYGRIIQPGMKVKLVAAGLPDIIVPDSAIIFTDASEMNARVDLRQKTTGKYDIVLTSASGTEYRKTQGFEVIQFAAPDIWMQIVGPDIMRAGSPTTFMLQVGNRGNCDAIGVPLLLSISDNATVSFKSNLSDLSGNSIDTLSYAVLDSIFPNGVKAKVYWLLLQRIPLGAVNNYQIEISCPTNDVTVNINGIINNPWFASPLDDAHVACFQELFNTVKGLLPLSEGVSCVTGLNDFKNNLNGLVSSYSNVGLADLINGALSTGLNCYLVFNPEAKIAAALVKAIKNGTYLLGNGLDGYKLATTCGKIFNPDANTSSKSTRTSTSHDPNDKIGSGVGLQHYVTGKNALEYGILFENSATAGLPAQVVKITDTLDGNKLELNTFQLSAFNFSGKYYNISPGQKNRQQYIDLRPEMNIILQVNANFDTLTGVFKAELTSLDPATLQLTTNPLIGFLPPNVNAPEGEGGFYFTVNPKSGLPNKSTIENKALIYFDNNAPTPTPVWVNTIDKTAPTSSVTILPPITSDTAINLSWQGTDGESGVEKYNLYYSMNGGTYNALLENSNLTSGTFIGEKDSTYSFYSIAIDSVGNKEVKSSFDTKTTVTIIGDTTTTNGDIKIFPNPNNGSFIVQSQRKISDMKLYDMQGKQIDIKYTGTDNQFRIIAGNHIPAGMYILKIQIEDKIINKKILLTK
ncbi:MAG: T9SS type A sorting domain-containing protein [Chitinophagaceae bacterium]|jgi:hypothetical protein|nr:T9SS type A sorting domain-containing protein [Chitinophagaceae bacterium]